MRNSYNNNSFGSGGRRPRTRSTERISSRPSTRTSARTSTRTSRRNYTTSGMPSQLFSPSASAMTYSYGSNLRRFLPLIAAVFLVLLIGFIGFSCANSAPVKAKVNGKRVGLPEENTVAMAITEAGINTTPGSLVAVDGSIIKENGGTPFTATINGEPAEPRSPVPNRANVEVTAGQNIQEDYYERLTYNITDATSDDSWGSIREVKGVSDEGAGRAIVGRISGVMVEKEKPTFEQQGVLHMFDIETKERVIALTFDDGPWDETTEQILDILDENDAKATFFVVGNRIDEGPEMAALVKREYDSGHQICTHTYSHAFEGAGYDLGLMTHDARVEDVTKGQKAIEKATGSKCNQMFRAPGGNYSPTTAASISPYITYEIGWTLDTLDWQKPGAKAVEEALLTASPGDIVLMHDGGGDREQTVEALRAALPKLKDKGYTFVTVEELMNYHQPEKSEEASGGSDDTGDGKGEEYEEANS